MKEYLLIIKTEGSVWTDLSPEKLQQHLSHGEEYIGGLVKSGKLKGANPIEPSGSKVLVEDQGTVSEGLYEGKLKTAGFFHIAAKDMEEAASLAKANPIFKDLPTQIEIHPMMPIGGN